MHQKGKLTSHNLIRVDFSTTRSQINSSPVSCLYKDFILGSINAEEKWFLSRDGAWDGILIEGLFWGSCRVK